MTSRDVPDLREKGAKDQTCDRRLFMQLQAFTGCRSIGTVVRAVKDSGLDAVVYADANDPWGAAVLLLSEDPALFVDRGRELYSRAPFDQLRHRPDLTMIGRTYGIGREPNLEFALLKRPKQTVLNPAWPWAVWYPLRRRPEFALLSPEEQGRILHEHATLGMAWGRADLAHDIRLACHGLDRNDNDFVLGLVGKDLFPLSRLVQEMRRTQQTAKWIRSLGPFFVGRALFQSPP